MTIKHELHVKQAKSAELRPRVPSRVRIQPTCALSRRFSAKALGLGTISTLKMTVRSLGEAIEGAADLCNEDDESD